MYRFLTLNTMLKKHPPLKIVIGLLLITSLGLTACGSFFDDLKSGLEGSLGDDNTTNSGDVITSLNRYSDLVNTALDEVSYAEDNLYYLESDITDYIEYEWDYKPEYSCSWTFYDYDAIYTDTRNPSSGLTDTEQAQLIAKSVEIFAVVDEIETECKNLSKHTIAQDYLDDDFAATYTMVDEMNAKIDEYYVLHDEMLELLDVLYDTYENFAVDPNDPTSVALGQMRDSLDAAELVLDIVEASYVNDDISTASDYQNAYDSLTTLITDHLANKPDLSSYSYISDSYDYFYDDMDANYLPISKRITRDYNDGNLENLGYDYFDLLDYYNILVDDYNLYLDNWDS